MKWTPLYLSLNLGLICGIGTAVMAQAPSPGDPLARRAAPAQASRPAYGVHISPTRMAPGSTSIAIADDSWSARGFDLKTLIAQIYDMDIRRVDFPDVGATATRYDVTVVLPKEESQEAIQRLLQSALQKRFKLDITAESRSIDVYVLTAPRGAGPALHGHGSSARSGSSASVVTPDSADGPEPAMEDAERITYQGRHCSGLSSANGISVSAGTISEFRRTLEPDLDRLLVDDTKLAGSYDFKIGNYRNEEELFQLLGDQLGLVVVPTRRQVIVLAVRPV